MPTGSNSGAHRPRLQAAYSWGKLLLGYRLLDANESISLGPSKRATFIAPRTPGLPARLRVVAPLRRGYRLRLWPGMAGRVSTSGVKRDVAEILAAPRPRKVLGRRRPHRDVEIVPGDAADIVIDQANKLMLRMRFVDPPEPLGRPPFRNPLLLRTIAGTVVTTVVLLGGAMVVRDRVPERIPPIITPERFAQIVAPVMERQRDYEARARAEAALRERKRREREAAESRRAKEEQGKLGRKDAPNKETILPKGREDVLREKVSRTGVLAIIGTAKARGSGLGRLLTDTHADLEQAVTGLSGAKLVAGRGAGGLGSAGSGLGGGGTTFGRIQGSGDLDVGAGRGRGRKGPGLGTGKEKEVSVGMETGSPDAEGGLTKEQVNRVVRAHLAALKYCYEKELQRRPQLSGKIELFWVIKPNGTVDRAKVAASTMGSRDVEGCMERQVRNWHFPKSNAPTIVQSFPFLFKGGT